MVIVRNVKIEGDVFPFYYYPEGKEPKGYFKYNKKTKEIIEHVKSKDNEWSAYSKQAFLVVFKAIEKGLEIPKELMSAWY